MTEFRQPILVHSHLEMPGILVQLGRIQRTYRLAPQIDPKWSPTWSLKRHQAICPLSARDLRYVYRISHAKLHAQPSLSNIPKWDSNFGEPSHSHGTTRLGQNFPTSLQNQNTQLTYCLIYMSI